MNEAQLLKQITQLINDAQEDKAHTQAERTRQIARVKALEDVKRMIEVDTVNGL